MLRQNCDAARAALAAIETPARLSPQVAAHLLVCADCRAYRRGLVRMNQIARRLPAPTPPDFDMSRLALTVPRSRSGQSILPRRRLLVGGLTFAAALIVGGVVGPRFAMPRLLAAEISAAVARANTWHFVGWKVVENKRVRWEIWGRRAPFFYREQIGDSLLIATDRERIRLVPPGDHRPQGLVLTAPASPRDPKQSLQSGPESFIEGIGDEFIGRLKPTGTIDKGAVIVLQPPVRTTSGTRQIDEQGLLMVDARTKLPTRYLLRRDVHVEKTEAQMSRRITLPIERSEMEAQLDAHYDVPLPANVADVPAANGYARVDLTQTAAKDPSIPREATANAGGITVHGRVVESDEKGALHLRFDGWYGRQKADAELPLSLGVTPGGEYEKVDYTHNTRQYFDGIVDDQGNPYVALSNPVAEIDTVSPEWYLTPVRPLAPGQPRPRYLIADAWVDATWYEYLPEARTGISHPLSRNLVWIKIPLPPAASATNYDTRPVPQGTEIGPGVRRPLALEAANARARYYFGVSYRSGLSPEAKKDALDRAQGWNEQARKEANRLPDRGWFLGEIQRTAEQIQTQRGQ